MYLRFFWILLIVLVARLSGYGQIRVSRIDINRWVRENFTGQGVVVGNIKVHGNALSTGAFTSSNNILEIQKGLVLSTGSAFLVAGLNDKSNQSYSFGDAESDPDIKKYVKPNLYDVSLIEFDFVPLANNLQFKYQFGSEEYPEYVGSTYNDVFAFFISDDSTNQNIALIPGNNVPVSINTVNHLVNSKYYTDNNVFASGGRREAPGAIEEESGSFFGGIWGGLKSIFGGSGKESAEEKAVRANPELLKKYRSGIYRFLQFDGITKKLTAQAYVTPYKKYHMKIIIADVADNIFDSGVFIEDKSLTATPDTSQFNFADYSGMEKLADSKQILSGKKLENILPDTVYLRDANIYFEFDKAEVLPSEMRKLKSLVAMYTRLKNKYTIRVAGHTDSIGNLQYNMALSRKRNQAVMSAIQQIGSIDDPIEITEDAFLKPAAKNDTDFGRMKNRRVEIFFVKRD
ncbi:MAG: OmpA family protein [Sphingobacteriaceae bacterium]|nr:OmpA family protein [Sphingobacteriaceae bacterium]